MQARIRGAVLMTCLAIVALPLAGARLVRYARSHGCQPSGWTEWHAAMQRQCLQAEYVCQHMTSLEMLRDPEVSRALGHDEAGAAHLSYLVGRMRTAYGCAPEAGPPGPFGRGDVLSPVPFPSLEGARTL